MELQDSDEEEVSRKVEDIKVEYVEPIFRFAPYMSPWKLNSKVTRDLDALKFKVFTQLLPGEVSI